MEDTRTDTVRGISGLAFQGNIISHNWYKTIVLPNGKPDLAAIVILGDVVYWYKETIIRDEDTNEIIERRNKFAADKLQKTYSAYADYFGLSNRQVKEAIDRLVGVGVLTREFRNIRTKSGLTLSNVMYLEPIPAALRQIENGTFRQADTPHPTDSRTTLLQNQVPPDTQDEVTCTDITTDISTKELGATAPSETPAANAAPVTVQIVGDFPFEDCPNCHKRIPLKNLKPSAAICPHCGIGLYIYNADGERTHQPPAEMRKEKKPRGHTLGELPDCPDVLAGFPVTLKDLKAIQRLPYLAVFYEQANYCKKLYLERKCSHSQVAHNAMIMAQKRAAAKGQTTNGLVVTTNDLSRL